MVEAAMNGMEGCLFSVMPGETPCLHCILLDEPFSALDHPPRLEMGRLLKEIHEEFRIPVVLVTHDIFEAYTLADRMMVYAGGRIIQSGSLDEIFHNPSSYEVESLVRGAYALKSRTFTG